jgi:hypothetical protein
MASRVFSVPAVVLGASALISSLAVTPAAAWTHHRHGVRVYGYAPAHYATVVRHPVYSYRYGYPVAVYPSAYGYGYGPGAVASGIVNGAGLAAANIVGGAALAGGILGLPFYGYYGYPVYASGYGYPRYAYPIW